MSVCMRLSVHVCSIAVAEPRYEEAKRMSLCLISFLIIFVILKNLELLCNVFTFIYTNIKII